MTELSISGRAAAFPSAIKSPHAMTSLLKMRLPAHIGVLAGLSAGAYALCLAGVTGLQSSTEAAWVQDRAPALATIDLLQRDHLLLEQKMASARGAYEAAAAAYGETGAGFAAMEASLAKLAGLVTEINGSAASLPSGVRLPAVSRSVSGGAAPPVHTTTTASGK